MSPGQHERPTHEYARHGATSLLAALNTTTGEVLVQCHKPHFSVEFKKLLAPIDRAVPPDPDVHLTLDNDQPHETQLIRNSPAKRPRFHTHFTATSASHEAKW